MWEPVQRYPCLSRYLIICCLALVTLFMAVGASKLTGIKLQVGFFNSMLQICLASFASWSVIFFVSSISRYSSLSKIFRFRELSEFVAWMPLVIIYAYSISLITYHSAAYNAPLVDGYLLKADRLLGFNWPDFYRWVHSMPVLSSASSVAYSLFIVQFIGLPFILPLLRRSENYFELQLHLFLAIVPIAFLSSIFPASSLFIVFPDVNPEGIQTVSDFTMIREGRFHLFDPLKAQGIVSFPSFHAMTAIFFAYSCRNIGYLYPISIAGNAFMLVSTPTEGGHYLVDIFAGAGLALGCIYFVRYVLDRVLSGSSQPGCEKREQPSAGNAGRERDIDAGPPAGRRKPQLGCDVIKDHEAAH